MRNPAEGAMPMLMKTKTRNHQPPLVIVGQGEHRRVVGPLQIAGRPQLMQTGLHYRLAVAGVCGAAAAGVLLLAWILMH